MKTKSFKRIFALTILLVLCLSLSSVAYADPPTPNDGNIIKNIVMGTSDTVPTVTYTYEFKAGTPIAAAGDNPAILAGKAGDIANVALAFSSTNPATTTPGTPTTPTDTTKKTATLTGAIGTDPADYSAPGIYRYSVEETSNPATVPGLANTAQTFTFDVYVGYASATATDLSILGTVLHKSSAATPGSTDKVTGSTAELTTNPLTLKKTVSGSMGDRSLYFAFSVNITGSDGTKFPVSGLTLNPSATQTNPTEITGGTATTLYLKHGDEAVISGLTTANSYTITETAVGGYTTTYKIGTAAAQTGNTAEGAMDAAKVVEFINNSGFAVPTGIIVDSAPFVLLVLLAMGGTAALIVSKKSKKATANGVDNIDR